MCFSIVAALIFATNTTTEIVASAHFTINNKYALEPMRYVVAQRKKHLLISYKNQLKPKANKAASSITLNAM